jgi:hypothetical protein
MKSAMTAGSRLARLVFVICLVAAPFAVQAGEAEFHWTEDKEAGTADLLFGEQPVLRYMFAYDPSTPKRLEETYKVYHHVFAPGSKTILTKGPGGLYTHHRGLYVGWNKTTADGKLHDFWHCTKGDHLQHVKFLDRKGDAKSGSMTSEIHWADADNKPVISEVRTVTVAKLPVDAGSGYGWQIDWQTKLTSQRGTISLDGDRQHAGFQFRADQPVAEKNLARYVRPQSFPDKPEAIEVDDKGDPPKHSNIPWVAMTFELEGQRYNVEYFEDPSLPKPSLFSERPYGRFGAFFKTQLEPEKPLVMRYRINITPGDTPSREAIQKRFDSFTAELKSAK